MPQSPASPSHPVDFSDLGRPRSKASPSVRALPAPEPSGDLDELSADDILESDDIEPFEAAAAGIVSFEAPKAEPSGFEVGEVGGFDEGEIHVEGLAVSPPEPAPAHAVAAVSALPVPAVVTVDAPKVDAPAASVNVDAPKVDVPAASMKVDYAAPAPATLIGVPAAPVTSPMPLESVIVRDDANDDAPDDSHVKTLEIRGNDMSKVAAAAAALDPNEPQHTEVIKRSDMPPALHVQTMVGGMQAVHSPPPTSAYTPSLDPSARAHAQRSSSIDPMALDVAARGPMASSPAHAPMPAAAVAYAAPAKKPMTGLAIGGLALAAVALIGLVGIGGFAASRALADKSAPDSPATAEAAAEGKTSAAPAAAAPVPAAVAEPAAEPSVGATNPAPPATLDVSALPAAPVPGATPRGVSGSSVAPSTGERSGSGATAPRAAAGSPSPATGRSSTSSGIKTTALPPPGAAPTGGSTPLPPPAAAAPAPARAASQSRTGIVRVEPNLRAVVVDGSYRRATNGVLVVSCGVHRIKAGMGETKTVKVPCGGAVSL